MWFESRSELFVLVQLLEMDKQVTGAARVFMAVFLFPGRFPILKDNGLKVLSFWKLEDVFG